MTMITEAELRARELFERIDPLGVAAELDRRFVELAQRVVGLWTRRSRRSPRRRQRPPAARGGGSAAGRVRELYAREARRRLAAVQWLGQHAGAAEIEALQAVLSIEESEDVRREILCALREIEARQGNANSQEKRDA